MRKSAIFASVFACLFFAQYASAQQGDVDFGGSTVLSSAPTASSFFQQAERGGTYLNVGADVVFKRRIGFAWETAWRASQASYEGGYETYRPILTDFNALYQPRLGKKIGLDLTGGIGIDSTRFYVPAIVSCSYFGGCINYTSTHHFMEDLGAGLRYYVWHHVFVRPEIHYYHIQGNTDINTGGFSSDNLFRVGASIGYTIGPD